MQNETQAQEPEVGNVFDVSRISKIPVATLNDLRSKHPDRSPPFYRVGRRCYYPLTGPNGLRAWIDAKIAQGAAQ